MISSFASNTTPAAALLGLCPFVFQDRVEDSAFLGSSDIAQAIFEPVDDVLMFRRSASRFAPRSQISVLSDRGVIAMPPGVGGGDGSVSNGGNAGDGDGTRRPPARLTIGNVHKALDALQNGRVPELSKPEAVFLVNNRLVDRFELSQFAEIMKDANQVPIKKRELGTAKKAYKKIYDEREVLSKKWLGGKKKQARLRELARMLTSGLAEVTTKERQLVVFEKRADLIKSLVRTHFGYLAITTLGREMWRELGVQVGSRGDLLFSEYVKQRNRGGRS